MLVIDILIAAGCGWLLGMAWEFIEYRVKRVRRYRRILRARRSRLRAYTTPDFHNIEPGAGIPVSDVRTFTISDYRGQCSTHTTPYNPEDNQ